MIRIGILSSQPDSIGAYAAGLADAGYEVRHCTGGSGWASLGSGAFDLYLIDARVGGLRGVDLCRQIRESPEGADVPIVLLTSLSGGAEERIRSLEAGADDAVEHGATARELVARVACVARRALPHRDPERTYRDLALRVDGVRRSLAWRGVEKSLSPAEFEVVWAILERAPAIVSAESLARALRPVEPDADANRAREIIHALHRKIDRRFIETFRGWGYRYVPEQGSGTIVAAHS